MKTSEKTSVPTRVSKPRLRRAIERLENRRLLAAIEGNFFVDQDGDAQFDFFEAPAEGVTVFLDQNQNNVLDDGEQSTTTNANGNYEFTDLAPGDYFVAHEFTLDGLQLAQTLPGIAGRTNLTGDFQIDLDFRDDNLPDNLRTLVEIAASRWEQIIIGDNGANPPGFADVTLTIETVPLGGGTLARAGPRTTTLFPTEQELFTSSFNEDRGLTTTGAVQINSLALSDSVRFLNTLTHEIGHTLGLGFLWERFLTGGSDAGFGGSVTYTGENAIREYELFGGEGDIPVQPFVAGHWDEGVFDDELMTPTSEGGDGIPADADVNIAPLSRMTIGVYEDLGYEVSYASAQPYFFADANGDGQVNALDAIGALPEDLRSIGAESFKFAVTIEDANEVIDDANFGVRVNNDPNPFFLSAGPNVVEPGQDLRLLAEIDNTENASFVGDVDFNDSVIQVNFYRESNGTPGLQAGGVGGDELLEEDALPSDGFDFTFDTTGIPVGDQLFYARAYDRGYATTDREIPVTFVTGQTTPEKPTDIRVVPVGTNDFSVEFIDNATDESGYLLQVSENFNFDVPEELQNVYLPAQEGTGVYQFNYTLPTDLNAANTTRFFRVRAFNTAGSTAFAGRETARSLGNDELLFDNSGDNVTIDGLAEIIDRDGNATNLTYLSGTGSATFDLGLGGDSGFETSIFSVFVRNPDVALGETLVEVIDGNDVLLGSSVIDNASRGADVLIGTFDLGAGSFVRLTDNGGLPATVDVIRLIPSGTISTGDDE